MLFHEIYNNYFNAAAKAIEYAIDGKLNKKSLDKIVDRYAFGESFITIPDKVSYEWNLIDDEFETPIMNKATMPLSELQRRWLRSILDDPRLRLFMGTDEELNKVANLYSDVKPLYDREFFRYFDRYGNGDPYEDENYINVFRKVMAGIKERRRLHIDYRNRHGYDRTMTTVPVCIEYSSKNDVFRVICSSFKNEGYNTLNMGRIVNVELGEALPAAEYEDTRKCILNAKRSDRKTVNFEIADYRNALERVMLHFSDLEKETMEIREKHYEVKLYYDSADETEILIRLLSFGEMIKVTGPDAFVARVKERIQKQKELFKEMYSEPEGVD